MVFSTPPSQYCYTYANTTGKTEKAAWFSEIDPVEFWDMFWLQVVNHLGPWLPDLSKKLTVTLILIIAYVPVHNKKAYPESKYHWGTPSRAAIVISDGPVQWLIAFSGGPS